MSTQRSFKSFSAEVDLPSYGVTDRPVHLLVPDASGRSRGKNASFHVWKGDIPVGAFLRVSEHLFASTPQFVLLQMASHNHKTGPIIEEFVEELNAVKAVQQLSDTAGATIYDDPFQWKRKELIVQMALVICEFAGFYRLAAGEKDTQYELEPFVTREEMRAFAQNVPRLYGGTRVQSALDYAFDRCASPMEAALALMLSMPTDYGGFGLPRPTLNKPLPTGVFAERWNGDEYITPDLLWEEAKLVIEYESDEFHFSKGKGKATSDATRANVLSAMGYTVLRATTGNVTSSVELDRLAQQVATVLGVALPEADDLTLIRRHRLHTQLMHQ